MSFACIQWKCFFFRLAADFLKTDYLFLAVGVVGGACSDVEQKLVQVTKFSKREKLLDVLKTTGKASELFNSLLLSHILKISIRKANDY